MRSRRIGQDTLKLLLALPLASSGVPGGERISIMSQDRPARRLRLTHILPSCYERAIHGTPAERDSRRASARPILNPTADDMPRTTSCVRSDICNRSIGRCIG
ncbi:hypothetical protein C8Q80DRAFT_365973 [Daedaleopsis nitida]|nr:hypothetical protein C8Q80DRAFT_365973 [Daedaleopsis nitida]